MHNRQVWLEVLANSEFAEPQGTIDFRLTLRGN